MTKKIYPEPQKSVLVAPFYTTTDTFFVCWFITPYMKKREKVLSLKIIGKILYYKLFYNLVICKILYIREITCKRRNFVFVTINYYVANISVSMAAAFITTAQIKVFDQSMFSMITEARRYKQHI